MPGKQLNSILVKPSGPDCNMACGYCFYLQKADLFDKEKPHRMNDVVLENLVQQALSQCSGSISFGWQGGEPTLMGLDFFRKAVAYQKKYGRNVQIHNSIQTNGLLLNEEWAGFLRQNNFLVGLSLDGPGHIHDTYRKDSAGNGTFSRIHHNAETLLEYGVDVNVLAVVNDYSVKHARDIYEFFKNTGIYFMQFIPCVEQDPGRPGQPAPFSVQPRAYSEFLKTLFDLWWDDIDGMHPKTSIRLFDSLLLHLSGSAPLLCTMTCECGSYLVVEHNGDVFSCDFFVEPEWKLGNILDNRLLDMLNSDKQDRFGKRKAVLPAECMACEWLEFCGGGCPKDRISPLAETNRTWLCESYKMLFSHAIPRLKKLAAQWKAVRANNGQKRNPGRNEPCPCGSGKKFKHCCGKV